MMPSLQRLVVEDGAAGERLDVYLARRLPELSRTQAQRLIKLGEVLVDGRVPKARFEVAPGQEITISVPPPQPVGLAAQAIPLDVRYEDHDLIVVNKPVGMVVHPGAGRPEDTLVNALLAHCSDLSGIGGELRPGIVHRLDKDTSGLLVAAKNDFAHAALAAQLKPVLPVPGEIAGSEAEGARRAGRRYLALVWGQPREDRFVVRTLFGRHPKHRVMMAVLNEERKGRPGVREAVTEVRVRERLGPITLIEARLQTGRTHQIRVHMAHGGHPVVGDPTYGGRRPKSQMTTLSAPARKLIAALPGQALHAYYLAFDHPRTGERMEFTADPPEGMQSLIAALRGEDSARVTP